MEGNRPQTEVQLLAIDPEVLPGAANDGLLLVLGGPVLFGAQEEVATGRGRKLQQLLEVGRVQLAVVLVGIFNARRGKVPVTAPVGFDRSPGVRIVVDDERCRRRLWRFLLAGFVLSSYR